MVSINDLKMVCKGFKKVPLKDTKGVLTKANNFKWVKNNEESTEIVLSTGTKITKYARGGKEVITPTVKACRYGNLHDGGGYIISVVDRITDKTKFFKLVSKADALKEKAQKAAAALNKKRQAFIENFNKKYDRTFVKGDDGSITKLTHDKKTGKLVHWFRKDGKTGRTSIGDIFNYPGGMGKELVVETPDKFIYKNVLDFRELGDKKIAEKVDIPKNKQ